MNGSYWIGVAAAVAAGVTFNLGILIQKLAVMKTSGKEGLMRQLVRSPLWLAGFALQFIIGMPLNMLAQTKIGPAIIPGLMAIGLIVLAIGAVRLAGERIQIVDVAGISLVIAAVIVFGLSRLSVDMQSIDLYEPAFLVRLGAFTMFVAALSLLCHMIQKANARLRGILRTLNAGLLLSQSNLWLGVLMALTARWGAGRFSIPDLLFVILASGIVFAGSMLGIAETQRAFQFGEASRLIPIQYVPSQILPVAAYFAVFALRPATVQALPLAMAGIVLVLFGAILLARRQFTQKEGVTDA
jgi:drug/metabolite transporter (DMT)-like permease